MTFPPAGFLHHEPLGGNFYRAARTREIPDFEFGFLAALRGEELVASIPYFVTDFKFNTMLDEGWLKRVVGNIGIRIACVGHPCTPLGHIDPERAVTAELICTIYRHLKSRAPVVAFKGFGCDLPAEGFVRVAGLPVAVLATRPNFWNTMASNRRNFKRKRIAASKIKITVTEGLPADRTDAIYRLYLNTYAKANVRFEKLSRDYFVNTAGLSRYLMAFLDGELVGFIQLVVQGGQMAAFYMGMDNGVDKRHGLYFAMAIAAVDIAVAAGCVRVEFGETNYGFKRSMGCDLIDTWNYYRHRNPLGNLLMARLAFLLEPSEKELR